MGAFLAKCSRGDITADNDRARLRRADLYLPELILKCQQLNRETNRCDQDPEHHDAAAALTVPPSILIVTRAAVVPALLTDE